MLKIFKIFSTKNLKENIVNILSRFPVAVVIVLIVNILFYTILHGDFSNIVENNLMKYIISLIITFFFSVWVYINSENLWFNNIKRNLLQIIPILFWVVLFLWFSTDLNDFENFVFAILCSAWIISYLFFAPYSKWIIQNKIKQPVYYTYFYKISVIFLISTILWWVLAALGSIWITAVEELFDLRTIITDKTYQDWIILALAFFPPIFALTQIPEKKTFNESYFNENVFFSFLIKYIVTPFIYIYFIILYAYTIKVLTNFWDWPKWEVSWMVIWFSTLWYITYIFSYIFEEKNKFIKVFRKAFPYVVFPQLFMLFYAIYLRINQYDITVNRYFVVVFWIWLAVISLYYIFSKKKYLSFIPFILTIFTIIISIWPWSVYNLPESRQLVRLENNLNEAWILKNWEILPQNSYNDIDDDLSKNIYSWINYLCDFNNCDIIKELFPEQYKEIEEKHKKDFERNKTEDLEQNKDNEKYIENVENRVYNSPWKWEIVSEIAKIIKVKSYFDNMSERKYININIEWRNDIFPLDVNWYSKIYRISGWKSYDNNEYARINIEDWLLEIIKESKEIEKIDINSIIDEIYKSYLEVWNTELEEEKLVFEKENYKVIFDNIQIKNPDYKWEEKWNWYWYANWYLLIK